jgi:hypothetical protein
MIEVYGAKYAKYRDIEYNTNGSKKSAVNVS